GGTTAAALEVLMEPNGLARLMNEAGQAGTERSRAPAGLAGPRRPLAPQSRLSTLALSQEFLLRVVCRGVRPWPVNRHGNPTDLPRVRRRPHRREIATRS